ncbi:sugar porter family MFS transporter [Polaribacter glomeratus]|uniref:MFS transporter n=1 Tax=Polaribacter glomeratus TaxID=102 RepID=A0A2S7WZG9_9FLAO|nr:sugar porter family MFS transporter [Polaribacter glomeratus]PQJ82888.1 MFS transporter [Polaribacter glomeratus]TXD64124.1 sugar porter family MFS transporter [Polaribacter glomeratus]
MNNKAYTIFISFIVALGGFLFGFDAGIISGVMSFAGPQFNLTEIQSGWVVSAPSFAAMFAMLFSGRISDIIGRKKTLIFVAFLYAISALLSAIAPSYEMLYIARMIGGLAFGAALVLAPIYIAEISTAENRGKLVSLQQLNIVFGFFAAFLSNYFFNKYNTADSTFLTDETVWRWMLGVELIPALFYFVLLFFVPKSPRWLYLKKNYEEAEKVLNQIHGVERGRVEIASIEKNIHADKNKSDLKIKDLLKPSLRFILVIGLVVGILQQITGINAVYFYATSIFKQTGIGTDAAFSSGVLLSTISVIFTFLAIYLIDRMGRRPLLLIGTAGIAVSLLLCAYSFNNATYQLSIEKINQFEFAESQKLVPLADKIYENDLDFKNEIKAVLGNQVYSKNDGEILEAATNINANLVLIGILGFIACFAFSLGPVMWVLLSELYPIKYRGIAIGVIAFINSLISSIVQLVFPWEISNLGNALTFFLFGAVAVIGFFVMLKIVPETKGKSLEELERELVKDY